MKKLRLILRLLSILVVIAPMCIYPGFANAKPFMKPHQGEPEIRTDYHDETGRLSFMGVDPVSPIVVEAALQEGLNTEDRALAVLGVYGSAFGLTNLAQELELMRIRVSEKDRSSVHFQQIYKGVPVLAGELIVNQDSKGQLISISGEISPELSVAIEPTFSNGSAKQATLEAVAKYYGLTVGDLEVTDPELWIIDERLLRPSARPPTLVWRMEVSGTERLDIRELVLVDAHFGAIVLHFNQIDTARNRNTYDANNGTSLPGTLICNEADPMCTGAGGDQHAIKAHVYAGDTYNFYATNHGRDSIDNAGMTLVSTVHYGSGYANAFWNGSQMVYGDAYGFALADDVVGHELSHGVTDYESHLFYFYQSGAINESFSDVWGEFVDQTNGAGDDSPAVKWLMGEDVTGLGALRDMADPPAFGDPDKISSGNYYCGTSDNGGVHWNSGVSNKAAYLMTDGDTFNGYVVTGLGIPKVADLFYEVNTNLFTSGGNFNDLYNALIQASYNLGYRAADRQEVQDAVNATEMNQKPCSDPAEAPVCSAGYVPVDLFFDDLENTGSGNWVSAADVGLNEWYYPQNPNPYFDATNTSSGIYNFWGNNQAATADFNIAMTSDVTLPSNAYMHFKHYWDFEETNYDGGVVEYSTTGGSSWVDAGSLFTHNGYTGTLSTCCGNPIGGQQAFANESRGYTSSRLNLNSLSGQNVRFRFRIGTDSIVDDFGWFIDDIRIYTCRQESIAPADFDGDGTSDVVVFRGGAWLFYDYATASFDHGIWTGSTAGCIPAPMDYDGDQEVEFTQLCNGAWKFYNDDGSFNKGFWTGGVAGDLPVPADYDGDGTDEVVLWRNGAWIFYDYKTGGFVRGVWTGAPPHYTGGTTLPAPMDYNGDGTVDFTVYSGGPWTFYNDYGTYIKGIWTGGVVGDMPVPADYDGDGIEEPTVWRNGAWLVYDYETMSFDYGVWTGSPPHWTGGTTRPAPLDYDGDGEVDFTVFSGGPWHFFNDGGSLNKGIWTGGVAGDQAVSRRPLP